MDKNSISMEEENVMEQSTQSSEVVAALLQTEPILNSADFFESLDRFEEILSKSNFFPTISEGNAPLTAQMVSSTGCSKEKLYSSMADFFNNVDASKGYCDLLRKYVMSSSIRACCAIIGSNQKQKMEKYIVLSMPYYFIMNAEHNVVFTGKKKELNSLFQWFVRSMFPSMDSQTGSTGQIRKIGVKLKPNASGGERYMHLIRKSLKTFIEASVKLSMFLLESVQKNEIFSQTILDIGDDDAEIHSTLNALPVAVIRHIEKTISLDADEIEVMRGGYVGMLASMAKNSSIISPPCLLAQKLHGAGKPRSDLLKFVLDPSNHNHLFPPERSTYRKEQMDWCQTNCVVQTSTIPNANDGLFFNKSGTLKKGCILYYSGTVFHETSERKLTKEMESRDLEVAEGIYIVGNYNLSMDYTAKMNHKPPDLAQWKFVNPFKVVLQKDIRGLQEMFVSYNNDISFSEAGSEECESDLDSTAKVPVDAAANVNNLELISDSIASGTDDQNDSDEEEPNSDCGGYRLKVDSYVRKRSAPQRFQPELKRHRKTIKKRRHGADGTDLRVLSTTAAESASESSGSHSEMENSCQTNSQGINLDCTSDSSLRLPVVRVADMDPQAARNMVIPKTAKFSLKVDALDDLRGILAPQQLTTATNDQLWYMRLACIGFMRGKSTILNNINETSLTIPTVSQKMDHIFKNVAVDIAETLIEKELLWQGHFVRCLQRNGSAACVAVHSRRTVLSKANVFDDFLEINQDCYFPSTATLGMPYGYINCVRTVVVSGKGRIFIWPNSSNYLLLMASKGFAYADNWFAEKSIMAREIAAESKEIFVIADHTVAFYLPDDFVMSSAQEPVGPENRTIFVREFSCFFPVEEMFVSKGEFFPTTTLTDRLRFFQKYFIFPDGCELHWHSAEIPTTPITSTRLGSDSESTESMPTLQIPTADSFTTPLRPRHTIS